jgi:hypothetical protein
MTHRRRQHAAARLTDGTVLVVGGSADNPLSAEIEDLCRRSQAPYYVEPLESTALSDVSVHIGAPRPRATATDHLEACPANHVLHR